MMEGTSRRLAREFREKIKTGQWPAGQRVPTTRELAASYGVSVNTVQNAFRELEASQLIERKPRLGGYVKPGVPTLSPAANTIAVVGPYTDAAFASEVEMSWGYRIIRGCEAELGEANFHVSMFSFAPGDPEATAKVLGKIEQAGETLGGLLCFISRETMDLLPELDRRNIAWVTVNRPKEHAAQNFVSQDSLGGSRVLGRCFARMGLKKVVMLSDRIAVGRSTGDKFYGFMEGWLESGRDYSDADYACCAGYTEPVGYERMKRYLAEKGRPDGVFASGDLLALGAIRALKEAAVEVGKDVQVVGATGLALGAYSSPALTVIEAPMEQLGREAARMLLEMCREGVRRMIGRYVATRLVVRESSPIPAEVIEEESRRVAAEL